MTFSYSAKDVTIVVLMGATLFVIFSRFRKGREVDWPLIYWVVLYWFNRTFDGPVPPNVMYAGFGIALFYRFEFLGRLITNLVKTVDIGILAYVVYLSFISAFNVRV